MLRHSSVLKSSESASTLVNHRLSNHEMNTLNPTTMERSTQTHCNDAIVVTGLFYDGVKMAFHMGSGGMQHSMMGSHGKNLNHAQPKIQGLS
jgi:hypothetical protein